MCVHTVLLIRAAVEHDWGAKTRWIFRMLVESQQPRIIFKLLCRPSSSIWWESGWLCTFSQISQVSGWLISVDDTYEISFGLIYNIMMTILIKRYSRSNRNIIQSEDEIENFHFRRRPTSFLCSNDPKRFTWMAAEQDAANADGSRYIMPIDFLHQYIIRI